MVKVEINDSVGQVHYNSLKPGDFFRVGRWSKQIYMKTQNGHIFITSYDLLDKDPPEQWFNVSENCVSDVIPVDCILKVLN